MKLMNNMASRGKTTSVNEKLDVSGMQTPATPVSASRSPSATLNNNQKNAFMRWMPVWIGRGIIRDVRARAPYYPSDWTDAWNYRVIPAIVLIFFAK